MTQDEIIRMAREVFVDTDIEGLTEQQQLERFAALVAAHEAKEHLKMLENLREETKAHCLQAMAEAYEMGKQDEREACAKVCEEVDVNNKGFPLNAKTYAAAIRARGNNK